MRVICNLIVIAARVQTAPAQSLVPGKAQRQSSNRPRRSAAASGLTGPNGCATFSDSPAFEPDGKWDGHSRRIGVNARQFDDCDAALAPVVVIDGKHLW